MSLHNRALQNFVPKLKTRNIASTSYLGILFPVNVNVKQGIKLTERGYVQEVEFLTCNRFVAS